MTRKLLYAQQRHSKFLIIYLMTLNPEWLGLLQIELMRLSQSLEHTSVWGNPTTDLCPAVRNAIDGAIFIANHLKDEDVAKRVRSY